MVSIAPVLVSKQAANQARASNPRSPPGSTGVAADTDTHSRSLLRRRKTSRQDFGGDKQRADREEEEEGCRGSERSTASASMKLRKLFQAGAKLVLIVLLLPVTLLDVVNLPRSVVRVPRFSLSAETDLQL